MPPGVTESTQATRWVIALFPRVLARVFPAAFLPLNKRNSSWYNIMTTKESFPWGDSMASANISITVEDLTADNSETIKKALEIINGVENVIVNIANQRIVIEYDDEKISEQLIRETIEDVGYKIK